ncbi:MAG: hypothetical protein LBM99_05295 [Bacillales bacterium]|jgi:hypothetical protein|nr:hypothetical protein [Bacillales bacterium]
MKKVKLFVILLSIVSLLSLSSCQKKVEKVPLIYGSIAEASLTTITYGDLQTLINDKANFILVVAGIDEICSCWITFKDTLKEYIKEYNTLIYKLSYNDLNNKEESFAIPYTESNSTFSIIKEGKVIHKVIYDIEKKISLFNDYDTLKKYLEERVILPKYFYLSLEQLNQKLLTDGEKFALYLSRKGCSYCKFINWRFLKDYQLNNEMNKTLYVIDLQQYHYTQVSKDDPTRPTWEASWQEMKNVLGLSDVINTKYGFGVGYTPTIQYIETNGTKDASQYVKDTLMMYTETLEEENEDFYKVIDSYYTEERLVDLHYMEAVETKVLMNLLIAKEDAPNMSWDKTAGSVYYNPIGKAFFDYYLK